MVRAVSLSHQVVGSKQPLRRFCGGRLALVFPFPRPHSCGSLRHLVCPFFLSLDSKGKKRLMALMFRSVGSLSATSIRGNPPPSHNVPQRRHPLQRRKYCHYRICSNQLASPHNLYLSVKLFKLITFSKIIRLIGNWLMQPCLVLFQSVANFACARLVGKERRRE